MKDTIIPKLMEEYRRFIRAVASSYHMPGHPTCSRDDLESEGYMVLLKIARKVEELSDFDKLFRTSLRNHFIQLWRNTTAQKHTGVTVDLSEVWGVKDPGQLRSMYVQECLNQISQVLSPVERKVLQELVQPSEKTVELAIVEFVRRRHLYLSPEYVSTDAKGKPRKKRSRPFEVSTSHIRQSLGLGVRAFNAALQRIREQTQSLREEGAFSCPT